MAYSEHPLLIRSRFFNSPFSIFSCFSALKFKIFEYIGKFVGNFSTPIEPKILFKHSPVSLQYIVYGFYFYTACMYAKIRNYNYIMYVYN